MKETPEAPFVPLLLYMTSAMLVWAAYFIGVYAFASIACMYGLDNARPFGIPFLLLSVGAATVVALAATATILFAAFLRHGGRRPGSGGSGSSADFIAMTLAILALLAIAWNGIPALLLLSCA
jgi:hypothetical protein